MKVSYALKSKYPYYIKENNEPEYCYNFDSIEVHENKSKEEIESLISGRVSEEWDLISWKKSNFQ